MSPSTSMVQMNTRIDADLKQRGDAVLERAGYSPSEAVRALWTFAVAHEVEPQAIPKALATEDPEAEEKQLRHEQRLAALKRVHDRISEFNERFGITAEAIKRINQIPDDELYLQALTERYEEKGLL